MSSAVDERHRARHRLSFAAPRRSGGARPHRLGNRRASSAAILFRARDGDVGFDSIGSKEKGDVSYLGGSSSGRCAAGAAASCSDAEANERAYSTRCSSRRGAVLMGSSRARAFGEWQPVVDPIGF